MQPRPAYLMGVLIWADQGVNALGWPLFNALCQWAGMPPLFGWPDETLSSVLGKLRDYHGCRFCYWVCRVLTWLDWRSDDHCRGAIEYDEGRL